MDEGLLVNNICSTPTEKDSDKSKSTLYQDQDDPNSSSNSGTTERVADSRRPVGSSLADRPGDVIVVLHSMHRLLSCPCFGLGSSVSRFVQPNKPEGLDALQDDTWSILSTELGTVGAKMWPNNNLLLAATLAIWFPVNAALSWIDDDATRSWMSVALVVVVILSVWLPYRWITHYMTAREEEIVAILESHRTRVEAEGYYITLVGQLMKLRTYEVRFRPLHMPPEAEGGDTAKMPIHEEDTWWSTSNKVCEFLLVGTFMILTAHCVYKT